MQSIHKRLQKMLKRIAKALDTPIPESDYSPQRDISFLHRETQRFADCAEHLDDTINIQLPDALMLCDPQAVSDCCRDIEALARRCNMAFNRLQHAEVCGHQALIWQMNLVNCWEAMLAEFDDWQQAMETELVFADDKQAIQAADWYFDADSDPDVGELAAFLQRIAPEPPAPELSTGTKVLGFLLGLVVIDALSDNE